MTGLDLALAAGLLIAGFAIVVLVLGVLVAAANRAMDREDNEPDLPAGPILQGSEMPRPRTAGTVVEQAAHNRHAGGEMLRPLAGTIPSPASNSTGRPKGAEPRSENEGKRLGRTPGRFRFSQE